jgi:MSHA biogenesis protein MshJ
MAKLVQGMLAKNRKLKLLRVENLPPVALEQGAADKTPAPSSDVVIYKHGLRIELQGQYVDILRYLRALETMPWKVFWGEMRLETENHPNSRVSLVIYTLSPERAWIGV